MQIQSRNWCLAVVAVLALLIVGIATPAAGKMDTKLDPRYKNWEMTSHQRAAAPTVGQDASALKITPKNLAEVRKSMGLKPEVKKVESLCSADIYWNGGPTVVTTTNGTATAWAAGSGEYYFAAAGDITHPAMLAWGDPAVYMTMVGNSVYVLGWYATWEFDVTDPVSPVFVQGWKMGWNTDRGFGWADSFAVTADQQYWIHGYDSIGGFDLGGIAIVDVVNGVYAGYFGYDDINADGFSELWTKLIVDNDSNTLIAADYNAGPLPNESTGAWIFDLSGLGCTYLTAGNSWLGIVPLFGGITGFYNSGDIFFKAPYLYGKLNPNFYYQPFGWNGAPDNRSQITIMQVPDLTNPANYFYIREYENSTDDLTRLVTTPTGLMFSTLQNHIWTCDNQMVTVLGLGTANISNPTPQTYDMDWTPGKGVVANGSGGERSFTEAPAFAETGVYLTGGSFAEDVAVGGNYIYLADTEYLIILQGPTAIAQIGVATLGLPSVDRVAASPDGKTLFVASTGTSGKFAIVDVTTPAAPVVKKTVTMSKPITWIGTFSNMFYVATNNAGTGLLYGYTYTDPTAPATVFSAIALPLPVVNAYAFAHPAYPATPFLAVNYGTQVQIRKTTDGSLMGTVNLAGITGFIHSVFEYSTPVGNFLYLIGNTAGAVPVAPEVTTDGISVVNINDVTAPVFGGTVGAPLPDANLVALPLATAQYAAWASNGWLVVSDNFGQFWQVNVSNNPRQPAILPAGWLPFEEYWGQSATAMVSGNGNIYASVGRDGLFGLYFNTDVDLPILGPDADATFSPYNAVRPNDVQGVVKVSWKFEDATTGITNVDGYLTNGASYIYLGTSTVATPPATVGTYSFSKDLSTYSTSAGYFMPNSGPWHAYFEVTDGGCNLAAFDDTTLTVLVNRYAHTSVGYTPGPVTIPGSCGSSGSNWYVCGGSLVISGTATEAAGNLPFGVTEVTIWVDGVMKNIAYSGVPVASIAWPAYTLNTTTMSEGVHKVYVRVVNASGLVWKTSESSFTVHNVAPTVYVVEPRSGDVVSGTTIQLSANVAVSTVSAGVAKVDFYLDPPVPSIPTGGTKIGTATAKDPTTGNWIAATPWNSTSTPYGDHVIVAVATEKAPPGYTSPTCAFAGISPLVSFRLIQYTPMTLTATAAPTSGKIPLTVAFNASVTGGSAPFVYAWQFGDGATGTLASTTHIYTTVGTFTWTVTVTDSTGVANQKTATGTITTTPAVVPPVVSGVTKVNDASGFRLKVYGTNFHAGCTIRINGVAVPTTVWKSSAQANAKGSGLKSMVPKGVTVKITVKNNDDGGTSADYSYTR